MHKSAASAARPRAAAAEATRLSRSGMTSRAAHGHGSRTGAGAGGVVRQERAEYAQLYVLFARSLVRSFSEK